MKILILGICTSDYKALFIWKSCYIVGHKNYLCLCMDVPFGHSNTNKKEYNKEFIFSSFIGDSPSSFLERA